MKKVTKLERPDGQKKEKKKLRTAAYCRVSTDSDAQLESLEAQKTHYENYINARSDWEFAGLYYDKGITGTSKEKRPELNRLMQDCAAGKIDFIITKSISRFSRNTADCLELVRKLLEMHIPVFFEKENLNTGSMESELFLSILSSMAEEESVSISQNSKWSIQKRFENGTYKISYPPYGYNWDGEEMSVNPAQAVVVREVFAALLSGRSTNWIADDLNRRGILTKRGGRWTPSTVRGMIANEKYTGDCAFQKTWSDSRFRRHANHGEKAIYVMRGHHEAIVSREDFEAAQALMRQRASEKGIRRQTGDYQRRYVFSGKLICGECGGTFKRRTHPGKQGSYIAYACGTHIANKTKCSMKFIREDQLKTAFVTMMNKLVFSRRTLLKPYTDAIKYQSRDAALRKIQQNETLLAQNAEKQNTLAKLAGQGIIDQILFNQERTLLLGESDRLHQEIDALNHEVSADVSIAAECAALLRFTEKGVMLDAFDEELFTRFLDHITICARNEFRFELKCGLSLSERI